MKIYIYSFFAFLLLLLLAGGFVLWYSYGLGIAFRPSSQRHPASQPHPAITIIETANPFLIWRVEGSFQVEFTDGFAINEKTSADDLPKDWKIRRNGLPESSGTIVVDDKDGRYRFTAEIDRHHHFVDLSLKLYESNATIVDLRTQKTVELVDTPDTIAKVKEFFEHAPR